jgi:lipopolysaccharide export LptBFGC system permease protein LptF
MIWTLYRYVTKDLVINFTLALVGLTTVLAIGGVLVRMRQEGLDSQRILLLFAYLLPVMLTITLPFASLFSATLVYGKLSSQNEINACRASGISVARLLHPAMALAVLTGLASLYMALYLIPFYTLQVEFIVRDNIKRVAMAKLRTRGMALIRGYGSSNGQLYADEADPNVDPPIMRGVLVLVSQQGKAREPMMADTVRIDFDPASSKLSMLLSDCWSTPQGRRVGAGDLLVEIPLPPRVTDRTKFRNFEELLALRVAPVESVEVRHELIGLKAQKHRIEVLERLTEWFARPEGPWRHDFVRDGSASLAADPGDVQCYRVVAGAIGVPVPVDAKNTAAGGMLLAKVTVEVFQRRHSAEPPASPSYERYEADYAVVEPDIDFFNEKGFLRLRLSGVRSAAQKVGRIMAPIPEVRQREVTFDGLALEPAVPSLQSLNYAEIQRESERWTDPTLQEPLKNLRTATKGLLREVDAELHSRFAMGACCLLFVFLGAGLGVLSRSGDYVVALAVSAIPGALTLGVVVLGRRVFLNMENPLVGAVIIWAGPALLLLGNLVLYRHLLRR